jgi:hypothetical protein
MCDPAGVHITRIYVNCSRESPSPIRSSNTVPVCTSTPIVNVGSSNPSPKQQMALLAKEVLASQRPCSETFIRKSESPKPEQYVFLSKETGQQIDFTTGEGIGKIINPNTGTITKKKKQRQSLAVVPPTLSTRMNFHSSISLLIFFVVFFSDSSKSSDDGDYLVPMTNDRPSSNEKIKTNFTSYDGIQMFTFTLDDD